MRSLKKSGSLATMLAIIALAALPAVAHASVIPYDLADLAQRANAIVEVNVTGSAARETGEAPANGRKSIVTDTDLHVTKVLKGTRADALRITQPGGRVGDMSLIVTELPEFARGERCILFLNEQGGVVGGYQGKLSVVDGEVPSLGMSLKDAERRIGELADGDAPEIAGPVSSPAVDSVRLELLPASVTSVETAGLVVSPAAATTLFQSTFEDGAMTGWTVSGGPTWGATSYRSATGSYSAYAARSSVVPPGPVPVTQFNSDMVRVVNLSAYNTAWLDFDVYANMQSGSYNWVNVAFATSASGPWAYDASSFVMNTGGGWAHVSVPLHQVDDYWGGRVIRDFTGQPTVYVKIRMSHSGTADEGAYVDNVKLEANNVVRPTISAVSPGSVDAGIGDLITITGSGFGATRGTGSVSFLDGVYLDGTRIAASTYVSWSDTRIVCEVPQGAQSGPVVVTSGDSGESSLGMPLTVGFSTGGYTAGTLPFGYRINSNSPDLTDENASIQGAFVTWNNAGTPFLLGYLGTSTATLNPPGASDSRSDIYFSATGFPDTGYLAWNRLWVDGSGHIVESDIVFNDAHLWANGAVAGRFDVQTVALHELGHTVGLDDQYGDVTEVMGAGSSGATRRALSQAEIDGLAYLYGATSPVPTTPAVSSSSHPAQATWYQQTNGAVSFSATSADGVAGYSYVFDTAAATVPDTVSEGTGTTLTRALAQGDTWFHVRAISTGGVAGPTAHYRLRTDSGVPAGSAQIGAVSGYATSLSVPLTAAVTDGVSGMKDMAYDTGSGVFGTPVAYASSGTIVLPQSSVDGAVDLRVRFRDNADNALTLSRTITLDRVAPTTTSDAQATYDATATVTLSASDAVSGVAATAYSLDGAAYASYTGPITISAEGQHTLRFYSADKAGNSEGVKTQDVLIDRPGVEPANAVTKRLAGTDRYATAAVVGKQAFNGWAGVKHVVIANGMDQYSSDPLAAAGIAGAFDAPLLLVNTSMYKGRLVGATEAAIAEIKAANGGKVNIHVVGGEAVVTRAAYARLSALKGTGATIERIAGRDRYSTSLAIAQRMSGVIGRAGIPGAFIANGQVAGAAFDALAISPAVYATHRPLLLIPTSGSRSDISAYLEGQLTGKPRIVVNASGYLSESVRASWGATTRLATTTDRKLAARQIADASIANGWLQPTSTGVANKLPDALAGGVALGRLSGPLLYTEASALSATTSEWLTGHKYALRSVYVCGGATVVTDGTLNAVNTAVH